MSCWYASAMMLIHWRRNYLSMTEAAHPDPGQVRRWSKLYDDNPGISNDQILEFARDMGLQSVPPMSPSPDALLEWLTKYGPLWVNGSSHITVIAGIRSTAATYEVLVFDPGEPHKKLGEWRSLDQWYVKDAHSGRDASQAAKVVFLRLPDRYPSQVVR